MFMFEILESMCSRCHISFSVFWMVLVGWSGCSVVNFERCARDSFILGLYFMVYESSG